LVPLTVRWYRPPGRPTTVSSPSLFGTGIAAALTYAVEPIACLRAWMRQKAARTGVANLSVLDGTLDGIPLPDGSADVRITNPAPGEDALHAGLLAAGNIADAYEAGGRSLRRYRARFERT
jgi:hypothetical protein